MDSHTSKRHWYIYVKNTGSNIADEDKDRIFERFFGIQPQEPAKHLATD